MNLPNKITLARIVLIIPFVILAIPGRPVTDILAAVVFLVASLTDFLDGHIARKRGQVTNFGKLMDPLVDKILVSAAMILLVSVGRLPAWVMIVILLREFTVDGLRALAAEKGQIIAASMWGKSKTVSQMTMAMLLLLKSCFTGDFYNVLCQVAIYAALALTLYSGYDYMRKGWKYIKW